MTLLSEIIVVNISPYTKPTILQWHVLYAKKGKDIKERNMI